MGGSTVQELAAVSRDSVTPSNHPDEVFSHYSIPAFDDSQNPVIEEGREIKSNKYLVPRRAVLLSKLNPEVKRVWLPADDRENRQVCSTEFIVCTPREPFSIEYIFCLFNEQSFHAELCGLVTGTSKSHQRVKPNDFLSMKIPQPHYKLITAFGVACQPMVKKLKQLRAESRVLGEIRDALLPKLLSGKIRVKDAGKQAEAVA